MPISAALTIRAAAAATFQVKARPLTTINNAVDANGVK